MAPAWIPSWQQPDRQSLAEVRANGVSGQIGKGQTRGDDKRERLAEESKADDAARKLAWDRCQGRCENCDKRVKRGGGLLHGAHFHHRITRSKGGRAKPIYRVLCYDCHFDGPSGAHTRSR